MKTVLVFVKAPAPGRVKTRLSPPFTSEQAAGARAVVAYEPHEGWPDPSWLRTPAPEWFPQEGADLGRRLAAATGKAFIDGAERVVVVGSDSPHLAPQRIEEAFARLATAPLVLGPARDGGYYLVGLREPAPSLFDDIPWSGPDVLKATLARAAELHWPAHLLDELEDVDDAASLARMLAGVRGTSLAPRTQSALSQLARAR